jgi:hypothetical protein
MEDFCLLGIAVNKILGNKISQYFASQLWTTTLQRGNPQKKLSAGIPSRTYKSIAEKILQGKYLNLHITAVYNKESGQHVNLSLST